MNRLSTFGAAATAIALLAGGLGTNSATAQQKRATAQPSKGIKVKQKLAVKGHRAPACLPSQFTTGLINWVKNAPANEDRYVWFVLSHSQATVHQMVGHAAGRLDYDASVARLRGSGQHYWARQPDSVSTASHTLPTPYVAPAAVHGFTANQQHPEAKVGLREDSPGVLFTQGVRITNTKCADGVMYGWEDVPAGQDPLSYPKTLFVVSFNKMSAPRH